MSTEVPALPSTRETAGLCNRRHQCIQSPAAQNLFLSRIAGAVCLPCLHHLYVFSILINGVEVPGYFTIIASLLLLGSIQLFSLGIIGEYVGRIYVETKNRPKFIVREQSVSLPIRRKRPMKQTSINTQFTRFIAVGLLSTANYYIVYALLLYSGLPYILFASGRLSHCLCHFVFPELHFCL